MSFQPEESAVPSDVSLRDVYVQDLPIFFQDQLDPEAQRMAVFPARDHDSFMAQWRKIMVDKSVVGRTIVAREDVAGNILAWNDEGKMLVGGYWLGRRFWGRGICSQALSQFLNLLPTRPLFAYVAIHNLASIRVLQKCGFAVCGEEKHSSSEQESCAEFIFSLFD